MDLVTIVVGAAILTLLLLVIIPPLWAWNERWCKETK